MAFIPVPPPAVPTTPEDDTSLDQGTPSTSDQGDTAPASDAPEDTSVDSDSEASDGTKDSTGVMAPHPLDSVGADPTTAKALAGDKDTTDETLANTASLVDAIQNPKFKAAAQAGFDQIQAKIDKIHQEMADKQNTAAWQEAAVQISKGITQFAAGLYGAKTGHDAIDGLKFDNTTDFGAYLDRALKPLDKQLDDLQAQNKGLQGDVARYAGKELDDKTKVQLAAQKAKTLTTEKTDVTDTRTGARLGYDKTKNQYFDQDGHMVPPQYQKPPINELSRAEDDPTKRQQITGQNASVGAGLPVYSDKGGVPYVVKGGRQVPLPDSDRSSLTYAGLPMTGTDANGQTVAASGPNAPATPVGNKVDENGNRLYTIEGHKALSTAQDQFNKDTTPIRTNMEATDQLAQQLQSGVAPDYDRVASAFQLPKALGGGPGGARGTAEAQALNNVGSLWTRIKNNFDTTTEGKMSPDVKKETIALLGQLHDQQQGILDQRAGYYAEQAAGPMKSTVQEAARAIAGEPTPKPKTTASSGPAGANPVDSPVGWKTQPASFDSVGDVKTALASGQQVFYTPPGKSPINISKIKPEAQEAYIEAALNAGLPFTSTGK